jgi:uracil-DNA glycosylase
MTSRNVEYIFEENLCDNDSQLIVCFCHTSIKSKNTDENFLSIIKKYPYVSEFLSSRKEDSKLGTIKVVGDKKQGQRLILLLFFQVDGKTSIEESKKWFDKSLEKISSIKGLKSIAFPHYEIYNSKIEEWSVNNGSAKIYIVSEESDPSKESSEEEEMNLSEEEELEESSSEEEEQNLSEDEEEEKVETTVPEKIISSSKGETKKEESEDEQSSSEESDADSSDEEEENIVAKPQPPDDIKQKIEKLNSFISENGGYKTPTAVKVSSSTTKDYGEDYDFLRWFWSEMQTLPYINPLYFINSYEKRDCCSTMSLPAEKTVKELNWKTCNLLGYTEDNIPKTYETFFNQFIEGGGMKDLSSFLEKEIKNYKIYPELPDVYTAFELCPLDKMKVVIIGQDPYHTEGVAMGVAFGHKANASRVQPSLKNIYKAVEKDGFKVNWNNGDITKWCTQGVFCINTALTVREGEAGSHLPKSKSQDGPWEYFTRQLLNFLDQEKEHLVIMLWGAKAQEYKDIFSTKKHFIITAPHPAASAYNPLNTEFVDSNCFTKANRKLKTWSLDQIDWNLE